MRLRFMSNIQPIKRLIAMLTIMSMVFLLNACGSDSDRHKKLDTLTANARVSDANIYFGGDDNKPFVYANDIISLDASTSRSHVNILSYTWGQTAGTPVSLTTQSDTISTFIVPSSPGEVLTFELEVVDAEGQVDLDSIDITIITPVALSANTLSTIEICAPIDQDAQGNCP